MSSGLKLYFLLKTFRNKKNKKNKKRDFSLMFWLLILLQLQQVR